MNVRLFTDGLLCVACGRGQYRFDGEDCQCSACGLVVEAEVTVPVLRGPRAELAGGPPGVVEEGSRRRLTQGQLCRGAA